MRTTRFVVMLFLIAAASGCATVPDTSRDAQIAELRQMQLETQARLESLQEAIARSESQSLKALLAAEQAQLSAETAQEMSAILTDEIHEASQQPVFK